MIPLDNLYEWIAGLIPDTVIYHFNPHGSKNIEHLHQVDMSTRHMSFRDHMLAVPVICYDQEPLDWHLYANIEWQQIRAHYVRNWPVSVFVDPSLSDSVWKHRATYNLAALTQTSCFDRHVLLHSEQRSQQIELYDRNGFEPAYWWNHALLARDWYRYAEWDSKLRYDSRQMYQFDFNVYSRAWQGTREYRIYLLSQVLHAGLEHRCRVSFCDKDGGNHYLQHGFVNQRFKNHAVMPWVNNAIASDMSARYDQHHYNLCAIDVVLETLFDDHRLHLTEKILRPMACGKPFLLAATSGSLAYLRSYGFVTFGDIIDESYDQEIDAVARIHKIVNEMRRISDLPEHQRQQLIRGLHRRAAYNREWFFSDQFRDKVVSELHCNLTRAVGKVREHHATGRRWWQERKDLGARLRHEMDRICDQEIHAGSTSSIRADVAQLLQHCRSQRCRH